jgi:hypothetical protein
MPSLRDFFDALLALKANYGWGWAVSFALLVISVCAFAYFYFRKYRPLRKAVSVQKPKPFDQRSLRLWIDHVYLLGLGNTDPVVTFRLVIENASDRDIALTAIRGEVRCTLLFGITSSEAGSGLGPARLEQERTIRAHGSYDLSFSQVFSPAFAQKIASTLAVEDNVVQFDFANVKLFGKDSDEVIQVARTTCWIKSPFLLEEHDQANIHQIQPGGLVSQERYDIYAVRKNK